MSMSVSPQAQVIKVTPSKVAMATAQTCEVPGSDIITSIVSLAISNATKIPMPHFGNDYWDELAAKGKTPEQKLQN